MKIQISVFLLLLTINATGQAVNETITLQLSQPPLLRVDAGSDLNLSESGFVILGESLNVSGGTPGFSYEWYDENGNVFYNQTPEVFNTGKYWLTVTDQNHCSAIDSLSVMDYGTGLNPPFSSVTEKVVWDGFNRILIVELYKINGPVSLSVLTTDGKILYLYRQSGNRNKFTHQVNLGLMNKGIYLLSIRYNHRNSVQKLILQ